MEAYGKSQRIPTVPSGVLELALRDLACLVTSACIAEGRDKLGMMVKSGQCFL